MARSQTAQMPGFLRDDAPRAEPLARPRIASKLAEVDRELAEKLPALEADVASTREAVQVARKALADAESRLMVAVAAVNSAHAENRSQRNRLVRLLRESAPAELVEAKRELDQVVDACTCGTRQKEFRDPVAVREAAQSALREIESLELSGVEGSALRNKLRTIFIRLDELRKW